MSRKFKTERKRQRQLREFRHRHRNNRAIPRHDLIEKKKPLVPSFPTRGQDAENRWAYHVLRLQYHARDYCEKD